MNELTGECPPTDTMTYEPAPEALSMGVEFTGEPGCIAGARDLAHRFLKQLSAEWFAPLDARVRDDVLLVVSELVTNAERHSHGPFLMELDGTAESVCVTVYDSSSTLPRFFPPDPSRLGGHGMEIVRAVSDRVSAERVPVGKRVRAVFDLGRRAASA